MHFAGAYACCVFRLNPPERPLSPTFLDDLLHAHAKLLCAMAELDTLTRGPLPSKDRIIDARWSISRASLARRSLWGRIHTTFPISRRRKIFQTYVVFSKATWRFCGLPASMSRGERLSTLFEIWSAYCEASRSIRWKMKASIAAEQRFLDPMLGDSGPKARPVRLQQLPMSALG